MSSLLFLSPLRHRTRFVQTYLPTSALRCWRSERGSIGNLPRKMSVDYEALTTFGCSITIQSMSSLWITIVIFLYSHSSLKFGDTIATMISNCSAYMFFAVIFLGSTSKSVWLSAVHNPDFFSSPAVCHPPRGHNINDSICPNGGKIACCTYCFFTEGSLTCYCDANNDCMCNSTLANNGKGVVTEVEVFVINESD